VRVLCGRLRGKNGDDKRWSGHNKTLLVVFSSSVSEYPFVGLPLL
jgi:hypothetical protein